VSGTVGERLRSLRTSHGVSLSELSRRSGVGKGTISELEHDLRGARLDTLFALTTALGAPLGALMPDRGGGGDEHVSGASVTAVLLERWDLEPGPVEVYRATVNVGPQRSDAHAPGVEETVTVIQGRVLVGPLGAPRELRAGESHRYAGDVPHTFTAVADPAQIVLLMHYPSRGTSTSTNTTTEEGRDHHDR